MITMSSLLSFWGWEKWGTVHWYIVEKVSCPVKPNSLQPHGLYPTRLLCPWNFPSKNTGMGCHSLLQGIFLTLGSNLDLLHASELFTIWATRKSFSSEDGPQRRAELLLLTPRSSPTPVCSLGYVKSVPVWLLGSPLHLDSKLSPLPKLLGLYS